MSSKRLRELPKRFAFPALIFTDLNPKPTGSVFSKFGVVWTFLFDILRTFRKRMGKQSGARCETHREIKVFPVVPTPEAIPNRTCNRNTPCVPSALSPSSRSPSPARTLPSTPATTPSPRPVWSRLATPTLVRYVSPRVHHCFVSVASREVTTRARARGARGIGSRRERARASARASATNPPRYTRSSALARRGR